MEHGRTWLENRLTALESEVVSLKSGNKTEWQKIPGPNNTEIQITELDDTEIQKNKLDDTEIQKTELDDTEIQNINLDNTETKQAEPPKVKITKHEPRISRLKFLRRNVAGSKPPASPIDEGEEDVNEFINTLIRRVDKNLK